MTIGRHGFYNYPEAARGWSQAQREAYTFGRQSDAHVRAHIAHARAAAAQQANDSFAAAIKQAGSISAFLKQQRVA
jgi:hypothetical protein